MFNECLYIWKLLNFYKYNTALYEIFINEPLTQCAVSLNCWFFWIGRWVVAYESLRWKQRFILKVVAVPYGSGRVRELFLTKFKSQFKRGFTQVVVTRADRYREWSQGELRLYFTILKGISSAS